MAHTLQQRPVSASLVSYTQKLPARDRAAPYDLNTLAADLLAEAKVNLASNNIVVPVLQCFNLLLENDVFEEAVEDIVCLSRFVARSMLQPARRGRRIYTTAVG